MAFKTEDFIIDLVKQLNLGNMDDATRARLKDLIDKGVATKAQKAWWESGGRDAMKWDAPQINAPDPDNPGQFKYSDSSDEPKTDDLKDLYLKLATILRDVASDRDLKDDTDVKKFLDEFYGAGKAVEDFESKEIDDTKADDIGSYIRSNQRYLSASMGISERDLTKLADTLTSTPKTYMKNAKSLKTFDQFLLGIHNWDDKGGRRPLPGTPPAYLESECLDLRETINTPKDPNATQLTSLKNGMSKLFGKLVTNDKLREKVLAKDTEGDITRWINKGLNETNYKEGDHALKPKYKDRKRFWQKAQDKLKENYVETVGKLAQKHRRHKYSTKANLIVEELIKKGVKPTDGTEKMLETFDAINGYLPNPVQKQLKWIKETMTKMKETDFFKDALKDGTQMRKLVSEIIKAAAHDDKEAEAELALETLAVMRYTMTTSSIRDSLRKTEVSIFSDPGLSWNKNEVMKVMSGALDKMIKYGTMALFEVGNFAKNAIRQNGLKFKKGTGRLGKRITDSVEYTDTTKPEKRKMMERLFARWDFFNSSANTKDYNIFRLHKDVQKDANEVDPATGKTKIQQRFEEYYASHNIGR